MDDGSTGALVPAVKTEPVSSSVSAPSIPDCSLAELDTVVEASAQLDKDFLCPICMQIIRDAFLTACGHSFCYMCIITHLRNKSDCPCCAQHLTSDQLFPNFLLDKLLKKTSAHQIAKTATPIELFRHALQEGCNVSIKELDSLLAMLSEKKRKMEQEESVRNMKILTDFLHCLRKQKVSELNEVQTDLQFIKEDISTVERHRMELSRARDRYSMKLRKAGDDMKAREPWLTLMDKRNDGPTSTSLNTWGVVSAGNFQNKKADSRSQVSTYGLYKKDSLNGAEPQVNHTGLSVARKKRVHAQFNDLQECYLQKRRQLPNQLLDQQEKDKNVMHREGYNPGLSDFQSVLTTFTQYSRLRVIAELRHGDLFHTTNIVSSIEFDRDDELFATAGVSRCIKVFDFSSVVNEPPDAHCPIVEMSTRAKLSCLSWDKQSKNIIASSDYEGIVTVWDVNRGQSVMEYEEHEKRAWSVDFSRTEPSRLVSGSDDCKVGSADHNIHYYDLRNISHPLHVFTGHKKAVSYVKFLSNSELASASTDSTLRLWDVKENLPVRTFRGHTNEKNFVGLTVNNEYIACGSETNEVFVYHKEISRPLTWHRFGSPDVADVEDDVGSYFISAVCWKSDSPTILTANSQGTIKVLVLAV
ncbi:E3 ubiquitin-protein ligase COP1 isoform X2 [Cucumis melo]|uniref:E3 ubiquitin-protein ligase COP1 isoform X2 n=1 Tax=Cucumis melo TaxID=3656 RepID=A0ABM3KCR9_CUCME|nr:E3 ubiquitin-protein ligase COP1 isoform X2 [Cucumis melo]